MSNRLNEARENPTAVTHAERADILDALRGEVTPDDSALVRSLFDAELAAISEDGTRPLETLNLAGWLLTRVAQPEDLWRFSSAKFASDRTAADFAGEHLLFMGIEETAALLAESNHPQALRVKFYLFDDDGSCYIRPARLARWQRQGSLVHGQLFADAA